MGRAGAILAVAAALASLPACNSQGRWTLGSPTFFPAALDYWHEQGAFLAGSYHDGSVQRLGAGSARGTGLFLDKRSDGRERALRLKVDAVRDRLWVLDAGGVFVYSLSGRKLLQRIALPRADLSKENCLPDIVLDAGTGTAYVSDNRRPAVYAIAWAADGHGLEKTEIAVRFAAGAKQGGGFSALALTENPPALIAGSAASGALWRIDLAEATAHAIEASPAPLKGICGMSTIARSDRLYAYAQSPLVYATTGFRQQVVRILLTRDLRRASTAQIAPFMPVDTPIGLVAFASNIVVAGSQLRHHADFGGDRDPPAPSRLVLMPARLESIVNWNR